MVDNETTYGKNTGIFSLIKTDIGRKGRFTRNTLQWKQSDKKQENEQWRPLFEFYLRH